MLAVGVLKVGLLGLGEPAASVRHRVQPPHIPPGISAGPAARQA